MSANGIIPKSEIRGSKEARNPNLKAFASGLAEIDPPLGTVWFRYSSFEILSEFGFLVSGFHASP